MKHLRNALFAVSLLLLPGCSLGSIISFSCSFMDDSEHCYQSAAVQNADPQECEKVTGKDFGGGSNPPRDKCYLMIAENTDNYSVCKDIQGGFMSYTQEQCVTDIVKKNGDPDGCNNLEGTAVETCKRNFAATITADSLTAVNEEVEKAKSEAGANPNDPDAQDKLKKLLAKQAALFENAPEAAKSAFMKSSREALLADIDDADVKAEIVRQTLAARDSSGGMSLNDQLAKMAEIKEQQETVKRLDEQANTLMDQIKSGATDVATDAFNEKYGGDIEKYKAAMAQKGREYLEANGGEKVKNGIAQLESLKEKYDKASEQYEKISEQIDKLKKVYDEVSEVYAKVDEVNKLVGAGKIDPGKAQALYGAIYLGKGLEYATKYIPVFGSTASTVSKEVMNATVKFATKRAARTTAIDKCIDDPEHCDPNGITPY